MAAQELNGWEEFLSRAAQSFGDNITAILDRAGGLLGGIGEKIGLTAAMTSQSVSTALPDTASAASTSISAPAATIFRTMGDVLACIEGLPLKAQDSLKEIGSAMGAMGEQMAASAQNISPYDLGSFAPGNTPSRGAQGLSVGGMATL